MKLNATIRLRTILLMVFALTTSAGLMAQDEAMDDKQAKKERKARSSFKLSGGATFNNLNLDSSDGIESSTATGYNLGLSYKRGRFFYWELGARLNSRAFDIRDVVGTMGTESVSITALDVPINGGIKITSFVDSLIGVRIFVGVVPSFSIGQDVVDVGLEDDDIKGFIINGQAGVGIDIAFFFVETGFNAGFGDIVDDIDGESIKSIPNQFFVNIGFRF